MDTPEISGATIFAVDDNPNNLQVITEHLRPLGVVIVPIRSGEELLKLVQKRSPDLILLDVMMPGGLDGFETCQRLKEDEKTRGVPVIFVSAAAQIIDKVTGFNVGGVDYISKPVEGEELRSRVTVHVAMNQFQTRLANANVILQEQSNELLAANDQMHREISERKRVEEELKKAKAVAEVANQAKTDFLARMSHEIRTPMNAIIGMSHLVLNTCLTDKQTDYIQKIQGSAHGLMGIINDILDFSKIEAGEMAIEAAEFTLEETLRTLANMFTIPVGEKGIELLFHTENDVPYGLIGDSLRLGQVLINLLGNAIKFTEKGEISLSIAVEKQTSQKVTLRFSVKDSGIGLTQSQADTLFQPFHQVDHTITKRFGGTGLGLIICKRLVTMMGGKISVESEPGIGSTFVFTATFGLSKKPVKSARRLPPSDLHGTRVLVVDNSAAAREIFREMFTSFSFEVSLADSGLEALKLMETASHDKPFDLVLMDWKMPEIEGIETVRRMKASPLVPRMPYVIMVTAYGREEVMQQLKDIKVDATLLKPVTSSVLLETIMSVMGQETIYPGFHHLEKGRESPLKTVDSLKGLQVLIVEDNEINQQVLGELLISAGAGVAFAWNGREAVFKVCAAEPGFDMVLMDLHMPDIDGYQASRMIRREPHLQALPIIAISADAIGDVEQNCLDAGMNDYISKPIDPEIVLTTMHHWALERDRARSCPHPSAIDEPPEEKIPAALPSMRDLPGIDMADGLARLGGNQTLFFKILKKFSQQQATAAADIRAALEREDFADAKFLVHTVKGVAGNIGATRLAKAALELEQGLETEAERESLLKHFTDAFTLVLDGIAAQAFESPESQPSKSQPSEPGTVDPVNETGESREMLKERFEKLIDFLADDSLESVPCWAFIKAHLPADSLQHPAVAALEHYINQYDFEHALEQLRQLSAQLRISLDSAPALPGQGSNHED